MTMQPALFDIETTGWQLPLYEYQKNVFNRRLPPGSILDVDLGKETSKSLGRMSGKQLALLCKYWGCPMSGTKEAKATGVLANYKVYQEVSHGAEYLQSKRANDLRTMLKIVKQGGGYLNKKGLIAALLAWADTVHEPFKNILSEARHYQEVKEALQCGKNVPNEVITGNPVYVVLERQAKGLPTDPVKMTTDEWLAYQNRIRGGYSADYRGPLYSESKYTSTWLEAEKHWQSVEKAIKAGRKLPEEVMSDHMRQTARRNAEIKATVTSRADILLGDKIKYGGKTGRVQHLRAVTDGFGYEYFIHTGKPMVSFPDQWEWFTAPIDEVDLIEPNPWIRNAQPVSNAFQNGDYVSWDDLDGRHWLGHVNMVGEDWVNVLLYSSELNPLLGLTTVLDPRYNPTLKPTVEKLPITKQAIAKHHEYWEEYMDKPNLAAWSFLNRLHDLFGLEMPKLAHKVWEKVG